MLHVQAHSATKKELPNMKEYRRPSLSVIQEKGNDDDDFVVPEIKVTSCEDLDQNRNERFGGLNGLLSAFHSDDSLKPGSDLIKSHPDSKGSDVIKDVRRDSLGNDLVPGRRDLFDSDLSKENCHDSNGNDSNQNSWDSFRSDISKSGSDSDLSKVKSTARRLNLGTRRPSYVEWQEKYLNRSRRRSKPELLAEPDKNGNDILTTERKNRIDEALTWLREELQEMRSQDQELARTLLTLRQDIQQLKLKRSYEDHKDMLEDVQCELQEVQEMKDVCDLPIDTPENPLKRLGVTPMNLSSRRFSIF